MYHQVSEPKHQYSKSLSTIEILGKILIIVMIDYQLSKRRFRL